MSNKIYLTYDDCFGLSHQLAEHIADVSQGQLKGLVCVLNGGLIPSYFIRKILKVKAIDVPLLFVDVRSYDDKNIQGEIQIARKPDLSDGGCGWFFIDEVCDTGKTVAALKHIYPNACYVALCAKTTGQKVIDFYVSSHSDDEWIVYPWEDVMEDETLRIIRGETEKQQL